MALVAALGGFLFGFDTIIIMMVAHLLWAWFVVPETRGRKLEDIA